MKEKTNKLEKEQKKTTTKEKERMDVIEKETADITKEKRIDTTKKETLFSAAEQTAFSAAEETLFSVEEQIAFSVDKETAESSEKDKIDRIETGDVLGEGREEDSEDSREVDSEDSGEVDSEDSEDSGDSGDSRGKRILRGIIKYIKFAKIEFIIIIAAIFLDLLTKYLIDSFMTERELIVVVPKFLQLHYVYNYKAAFGSAFGIERIFGEGGVLTFFIIFSIISLSAFVYCMYHFRYHGWMVRINTALVIGGAIGNLYDRLKYGYVRDFVEFVFFGADLPILGRTFAIFNIADACLVIGMILLMYFFMFHFRHPENDEKVNKTKKSVSKN